MRSKRGVRSRHEPARAGEGRRGPERAGQIGGIDEIDGIEEAQLSGGSGDNLLDATA